ncbi:MAG: cbb3-type cytochrome oxidase assembly protein CcoS [Leptonema sp. (in: bacteria)]
MNALFITIPLATILALIFLGLFLWSVKSKQYDDPEYIAKKIIFDDEDDKN